MILTNSLILHQDMYIDISKQRGISLTTFQNIVDHLKAWSSLVNDVTWADNTGETRTDWPCGILHVWEVIFKSMVSEDRHSFHNVVREAEPFCYVELSQEPLQKFRSGWFCWWIRQAHILQEKHLPFEGLTAGHVNMPINLWVYESY